MTYTFESDEQLFLTLDDGVSGMNQTAIARLAGVSQKSVSDLIRTSLLEKSQYPLLTDLYFKFESDIVINSDRNQKVYNSSVCHAVIGYYATKQKDAAIQALIRFSRIGITAFIQDLTGFKSHQGSDAEIRDLQSQLDILKEVERRQRDKINNLEIFVATQSSPMFQELINLRGSKDYFDDIAVLPAQVQRNAFKAVAMLKDVFWFIYKARRDTGVNSLTALSHAMIKAVRETTDSAILKAKTLPGKGHTTKDREWKDLFLTDFDYLYNQTAQYVKDDLTTHFGRRKDFCDITGLITRDTEKLGREKKIYETCLYLANGYRKTITIDKVKQILAEEKIYTHEVQSRIDRIQPGLGTAIQHDLDSFNSSALFLRNMRSYLADIVDKENPLFLKLQSLENLFVDLSFIESTEPVVRNGTTYTRSSWVYEEFSTYSKPQREHYYHGELYDFLRDWCEIKCHEVMRDLKLPFKSETKMTALFAWSKKRGAGGDIMTADQVEELACL